MQYRTFPKIPNCQVSALGFGTMRLPLLSKDSSHIDYETTTAMCKFAYEAGVNYFDTAYPYHQGKSEIALGKALAQLGIRDKIYIADKCPPWKIEKEDDFAIILEEQLQRLGTDYIDFYLLHALNADSWKKMKNLQALTHLEEAKAKGKIRHIGFSFHGSISTFKEIIDSYDNWEFCQIQYNYLDENWQAGTEGLHYAATKNLGVVVMEPLRGGLLANPPKGIRDIFAHTDVPRLPSEWGLRWVWEHQEVSVALSGMSTIDQMITNCATATTATPNSLPSSQLKVIEKARDWFQSRIKAPCTGCKYCLPCPQGVLIPDVFAEYNRLSMNGCFENNNSEKVFSEKYKEMRNNKQSGNYCISCGKCELACPQHIKIRDILKQADKILM